MIFGCSRRWNREVQVNSPMGSSIGVKGVEYVMFWVLITSLVLGFALCLGVVWLGTPILLRALQNKALLSHCKTEGVIALTFDDGPSPEVTPRILDLLDELKVKATFFMIGERVEQNPTLAREVMSRGHEVAAHSMRHLDAWRVGPLRGVRDVSDGIKVMQQQSLIPRFYRPPKGRATMGSIFQSMRSGCRPLWWTHDSGDSGYTAGRSRLNLARFLKHAKHSPLTKQQIEYMLEPANRNSWLAEVAEQGGVVLFHDAPRDHPELIELTMAATRDLVEAARQRGTGFVLASALR